MTEIKICDRSRSLEVSKKFYEKASRYGSDEYAMLRQARLDFPNYKVVVVARKASTTNQPTFKGLTYEYMEAYIIAHDDEEKTTMTAYLNLRGETEEAVEAGVASQTYMAIKTWFLEKYPAIATFHAAQYDLIEDARKKRTEAREQMKKQKQQERIAALMAGKTA